MPKKYSDRAMAVEKPEREYFFPKANPPQTVTAASQEEADKKLEANNKKENV